MLYNTVTQDDVNDLNNLGVRGQLLFAPSDKIAITAAVDHTRQRPEGYTQVVAGVAPTLRAREPAVPADRRRSRLYPAELQRLRPADRHRHAAAVLPGSRRRLADDRLEARAGPADLDHRLALLGLESVERPRLHRPAGDDDLGRPVEAAAMDAGGPLRRGRLSARERRRRRLRLPPGARLGPVLQAGTGRGGGALSPGAERAARRRPACSTDTASTSTSSSGTSARRCSASSNGRSPIACACCPASGSTTTRRTWTSTSRSMAACRRPIPR